MLVAWLVAVLSANEPVSGCTPLQAAVWAGDEKRVVRLVARPLLGFGATPVDVNERGKRGECAKLTPLMVAAERGYLALARILISSQAKLDLAGELPQLGDRAFDARCLAVARGRTEIVQALDAAGAPTAPCTSEALLFAAIKQDRPELVELQLRAHPSPATIAAALLLVPGKDRINVLEKLIPAGLEAGVGFNPVYSAALEKGDTDAVKTLSRGGARVSGGAHLARAITVSASKAIAALIFAGARTDSPEVREAISDALEDHHLLVIRALLSAGYRGDLEAPLMLQAVRFYPSVVRELVGAGVPIDVEDAEGNTALKEAAEHDDAELAQLLIDHGAYPGTANIRCEPSVHSSLSPLLPGHAARALGVTCGEAVVQLGPGGGNEVYLPGAQLPMKPGVHYRVHPGLLRLRVVTTFSGDEREQAVRVTHGFNELEVERR